MAKGKASGKRSLLCLHPSGQWRHKHKGRFYYFGSDQTCEAARPFQPGLFQVERLDANDVVICFLPVKNRVASYSGPRGHASSRTVTSPVMPRSIASLLFPVLSGTETLPTFTD